MASCRICDEVTTDEAPVDPVVLAELLPAAWHRTDRYANNRVECDHGRLKSRLRPIRSLKQDRSARVIIAGHALVQNVRRGHYGLAVEEPVGRRVAVAFDELAWRSDPGPRSSLQPAPRRCNATERPVYGSWGATVMVTLVVWALPARSVAVASTV